MLGESSEDNEDGGVKLSNEQHHLLSIREGKKPMGTASGPALGKENGQPETGLNKLVGTTSTLGQTGRGRSPSGQVCSDEDFSDEDCSDEESEDSSGAVRLFSEAVGKLKAVEGNGATNTASGPTRENQMTAPIPKVMLETDEGLIPSRTNSKGEPVFDVPRDGDDDSSKICPNCVLF